MALANVNSPRGFTPVRKADMDPIRRERPVAAGRAKDLMVGDSYTIGAGGSVTRVTAATDTVHGVVEGIKVRAIGASPDGPVSQDYIPATEAGDIIGIEDSRAEFVVQLDTYTPTTDAGETLAVVDADGNRPLRQSRQSVTKDGTHKQFQLIEVLNSPADNVVSGVTTFLKVVVRMLQTL